MRATFAAAAVVGGLVLAGCGATEPGTTKPAGSGSPAAAPGGPASPPAAGTAAGAPSAAAALPVGPGPQEHYTVQAQPAPGSCHYRYEHGEPLPDLACTPGAVSPAVTQDNLARTICKSGYTATIRPSSYVTGKEKKANALSYGYTGSLSDAEYDHQVSLELGGDPNDPRNLWVEPADPGHKAGTGVNNIKDPVETKLHTAVCKGTITLAQAQSAIATDWTTALADLGLG
jgi:hypothetical protein